MTTEDYIPSEPDEQVAIFSWADTLRNRYPALQMMYAIPNGSYKSKMSARKFAAEGLKSGVPDICLPVPSADGQYHSLYIELKRRKGGKLSDTQRQWIGSLQFYGNRAHVAKGADEAIDIIKDYLDIE